MKLRLQFAGAVFLAGGLVCSPGYAQNPSKAALAQQRQAQRQQQLLQRQQQQQAQKAQNNLRPGGTPGNSGRGGNANSLPPKAIERLQDLPPQRQEKFLQNNQRFQNLPPSQQAQLRERLQVWNKLTPGQQQDLRERQQVWEQMTPEQRRDVQQTLLPRWQQLPPQRRQAILQRLHSLRDLSEPERASRLSDPNFMQGMNPEDREMLGQLAHLHVGLAPDVPGL